MCVHTLKSAGAGDNVKQLQNALAAKTGIPGGVRLLAPVGEERVLASLQLTKLGVPVRHLAALQNLDVSFSVFDSYRALLPTKSGDAEQTVSGLTVESTKLATILELEFAAFWSRFDVLPHPDFVRYTIGQIMETSPTISLAAVAHRLHVDIGDLRTLLPKFGGPAAHNFFVIGRPCWGKQRQSMLFWERLHREEFGLRRSTTSMITRHCTSGSMRTQARSSSGRTCTVVLP